MLLDLAALPPPTARLLTIPDGIAGVRATLKLMARAASDGKKHLNVRIAALEITQPIQQRDFISEVKSLHAFVRDRIRYVRDVAGVETLQTPERTLALKAGDCDDKSILLAALLESIGHKTRFHAVGFAPGKFSHVYPEVRVRTSWLPLEVTEPWEPGRAPRAVEHMIINVAR
jgi:transglutaminase-like putative cysteine protease